MLRFAQRIEDRMHRNDQQAQEQVQAKSRKEAAQEAQNQQFQREQRELINNLSGQISELRQAQASTSQPASQAFDMETLQKIVQDAQKGHASKDDLKALIDEAVSKQLSGVAKSADLEKSAARMEKSLHKVSGGSDAQIQEMVQKELASAINKIASHRPGGQQRIDYPHQQRNVPGQPAPGRLETQFIVEELPDDEEEAKQGQRSTSLPLKSVPMPLMPANDLVGQSSLARKKATVLSASTTPSGRTTAVTSDALARLQPLTNISTDVSNSHHSRSRASVMPSQENAVVRVKHSESEPSRSSKMSTVSVQPSPSNAIVRPDARTVQSVESKPSKSSKMSTMSVQPSDNNALVRHAPAETQKHDSKASKSSKMSKMSVQPSSMNTLVRPSPAEAPTHDGKVSKSSRTSKMSVQPSAGNAMVRSSTNDRQQYASAAEAMAVAQAKGGQLSEYGGHRGVPELPDDFPDNASQVEAWQKQQAPKRSTQKGSTISTVRPRNDRRGEVATSSPLKQIDTIQEEDEGSMALIKQSQDVSKKPGR